VPVEHTWHGDELIARGRRASGRAAIAIAENIAANAKPAAPVEYGTLRRSIHAAPPEYDGEGDFEAAGGRSTMGADLAGTIKPQAARIGPVCVLEVGSWLPYACVQETRHHYMTTGVQLVQGARASAIVIEAFKQEGMSVAAG